MSTFACSKSSLHKYETPVVSYSSAESETKKIQPHDELPFYLAVASGWTTVDNNIREGVSPMSSSLLLPCRLKNMHLLPA